MSGSAKLLGAAPRYLALLRSQYWLPETLESYRTEQLEKVLAAAARIPFYAERLGKAPRATDLKRFPILTRSEIEPLYQSVLSLYPPDSSFEEERSSGTSGPAVKLLFDSSHQRGRNAARIRYLRLSGWNPLRSSVWFVGATLLAERNPDYSSAAEFIRWFSSRLGVKFLSTWMPFPEQVAALIKIQPVSLYAFPSGIDGIVRTLEKTGQSLPSLRVVMCGGEAVDDSLRERVRKQLGVELRDNYGSTEAFLAFECPAGRYHVNAEHVMLEIVDESGRAVSPGEMGRVLVTTLENYLMPLVRYEIGDYAVAAIGRCQCGRTLPLLGRVLGRHVSMLRRPNGSLTSGWQAVGMLRKFPELKVFQIVQKSIDEICVRYVADSPLAAQNRTLITENFNTDLGGPIRVSFEHVAAVERASSGKFLVTRSEVGG